MIIHKILICNVKKSVSTYWRTKCSEHCYNDQYGCFVLKVFYSQLYMNGIEQHAMSIQALCFLHVQGIHLVCKKDINNIG